jgi:hypothetical protein
MAHTVSWLLRGGVLALAMFAAPGARADDPAEMQRCMALVQDKVSWEAGNPNQTHWAEANLRRLCGSGLPAEDVIECFQHALSASGMGWDAAITACAETVRTPPPPKTQEEVEADRVKYECMGSLQDLIDREGVTLPDLQNCSQQQFVSLCATGRPASEVLQCWKKSLLDSKNCPAAVADCVSPQDSDANTSPGGKARPPRPSATAVWVEGHWVLKNGINEWEEGYWEEPAGGGDTQLTKDCMAALQDQVSQSPTDPDAKHWPEDDLRQLCQSKAAVRDTVACFTEIMGETKDRALAISSCSKLHPA